MSRRFIRTLLLLWLAAAPIFSARAASVFHTYSTVGVDLSPPPETFTGYPVDFAGEQTFSDADGGLLLSAGYLSASGENVVHTVFAKLASTAQGPVVTVTASVSAAGGPGGQTGEFLLTIPAAQASDLDVVYQLAGSGVNGTDYVYLKGWARIKAGKTRKAVKVVPLGNLGGAARKTVKLLLTPGAGYTPGAPGKAKVTIAAPMQ